MPRAPSRSEGPEGLGVGLGVGAGKGNQGGSGALGAIDGTLSTGSSVFKSFFLVYRTLRAFAGLG